MRSDRARRRGNVPLRSSLAVSCLAAVLLPSLFAEGASRPRWVLQPAPKVTQVPARETVASARPLDKCLYGVSLTVTPSGAVTSGREREPCGSWTEATGDITYRVIDSFTSSHAWSGLPRDVAPGETVNITLSTTIEGSRGDKGSSMVPGLGTAGTTLRTLDGGRLGAATAKAFEKSEPVVVRWTAPPAPRGNVGEESLVVAVSGPGGNGEVVFRYVFQTGDTTRTVSLETWDGQNDPERVHMPLTFQVRVEDRKKPLGGVPVAFEVMGDTQCLADLYGIWSWPSRTWTERTANLASTKVEGDAALVTDEKGMVVVRLAMDFGRRRILSESANPCSLPFNLRVRVTVPADEEGLGEPLVEVGSMSVASAVYLIAVNYFAGDADGTGRWYRLRELSDWTAVDRAFADKDPYGTRKDPPLEEPTQARVLSRILIGNEPFTPPYGRDDFFCPIPPGTTLLIDASDVVRPAPLEGTNRTWVLPRKHGIVVTALWLDGTIGLFKVRNRNPDVESVLWLRVTDGTERSASGLSTAEQRTDFWLGFLVNQAGDFLIKTAAVGVATLAGGPFAGAIVGGLTEIGQLGGDLRSIREFKDGGNAELVLVRSTISVTTADDGRSTLYNFEGSPGIRDRNGEEVRAAPGEAIDFVLGGEVSPPVKREPPAEARALLSLLPSPLAPIAGPPRVEAPEATPVSASATSPGPAAAPASTAEPLIRLRTAVLLSLGGLILVFAGIAIALSRQRPKRAALRPANARGRATESPGTRPLPPVGQHAFANAMEAKSQRDGPCLVRTGDPRAGETIHLGAVLRIGRGSENDVALEDKWASRRHALLERRAEGWVLTDLGSQGGTLVNGYRVTAPVLLRDGDLLAVGATGFRFFDPDSPRQQP